MPHSQCIFCRADSSESRSREHVIPESLGNSTLVLPPGIVCDSCNNYFSREVERPFLESEAIKALRFHQGLQSKKGRVPSLNGIIIPDIPALLTRFPKYDFTSVSVSSDALERLKSMSTIELILPTGAAAPSSPIISRFIAKVALEALAHRVVGHDGGVEYVCDERQLDDLRNHARRGALSVWPVHARTIYSVDAKTALPGGLFEQVLHESDFLWTPWGEWFFSLVLFGLELTINLGGPEIDGYLRWLKENNGESPLYRAEKPSLYPKPSD
jgi:hypothetical protein